MDHFPVITGQLSGFGADIYLETMDRCPITHRIHFHERIACYFWPGDSGWQYTNMWKYKRIFSDCIPGNGRTSKYFRKVIHWKPIQIYLEVAGQSGYSWKVIRIFFYSVWSPEILALGGLTCLMLLLASLAFYLLLVKIQRTNDIFWISFFNL